MGVMVNGQWHEELADPNDNGGGSNLSSVSQSPTMGGATTNQPVNSGTSSGGGGGSGAQAADGQTLAGQSPQTQQNYRATYGDRADAQWVADHNKAIGAVAGSSTTAAPQGQTYATSNGPRSVAQMTAELAKAGYNGPTDQNSIVQAYARTTGSTPVSTTPQNANNDPRVAQLQGAIDQLLKATAQGNDRAFFEAVRQFDLVFGLDRDKFGEDIRQFNESLALKQGELTGTYQGAPTLAANKQQADIGLAAIKQAADLQANPFRQQEVLGQLGGLLSGAGVAGFSSPNTVAGVGTAGGLTPGGTGMGYLQQIIDDIRSPAGNQAKVAGVLDAIPTPNKLDSSEFIRAPKSTQSMVLQGMQEKYGINPDDALKQIQNTLPQFNSPTTLGGVQRR